MRNRALDELRRPRMLALETPAADVRLTSDDTALVALRREHLRSVVGDIAMLPDRQRNALVAHVLQGAPHADLATSPDTSVPATKNLINRARTALLAGERAQRRAGRTTCRLIHQTSSREHRRTP